MNKLYFTISSYIYPKFVMNSIKQNPEKVMNKLQYNKANQKLLEKILELINNDDFKSIESANK